MEKDFLKFKDLSEIPGPVPTLYEAVAGAKLTKNSPTLPIVLHIIEIIYEDVGVGFSEGLISSFCHSLAEGQRLFRTEIPPPTW